MRPNPLFSDRMNIGLARFAKHLFFRTFTNLVCFLKCYDAVNFRKQAPVSGLIFIETVTPGTVSFLFLSCPHLRKILAPLRKGYGGRLGILPAGTVLVERACFACFQNGTSEKLSVYAFVTSNGCNNS